jgi:hypothetical protein
MAGLVPAIHAFTERRTDVDARTSLGMTPRMSRLLEQ